MDKSCFIFISYRHNDDRNHEVRDFAEILSRHLPLGKTVFFDKHELTGKTGDFQRNIADSIDGCSFFVPLLTSDYLSFVEREEIKEDSDFCYSEVKEAIKAKRTIVPIFMGAEYIEKTGMEELPPPTTPQEYADYLRRQQGISGYDTFSDLLRNLKKPESEALDSLFSLFFSNLQRSFPVLRDFLEAQSNVLEGTTLPKLSDIYFEPSVRELPSPKEERKTQEGGAPDNWGVAKNVESGGILLDSFAKNSAAYLVLSSVGRKHIALLCGEAGSGKSSFAQKLCMDLATLGCSTSADSFSGQCFFPFYWPCKDFVSSLSKHGFSRIALKTNGSTRGKAMTQDCLSRR